MRELMFASVLAIAGCTGCVWDGGEDGSNTPVQPAQTEVKLQVQEQRPEIKTDGPVRYLVVGMETSRRFGSCPGCEIDAKRINAILSNAFGYKGDILISDQATKVVVASKLREGISATPDNGMFIFCYSGHGGQEYLGGKEPDGAERQDEYLCLYDTYMQDDEIWEIVSKCKGRVFLYFDACHSATMYRSVASDKIAVFEGEARAMEAGGLVWSSGFSFNVHDRAWALALDNADGATKAPMPNLLCWSGCKELEYSYGGSRGGVMTNSLVRRWGKGMTYRDLWKMMVSDVQKEQPTQHPTSTSIGYGFGDSVEAFK